MKEKAAYQETLDDTLDSVQEPTVEEPKKKSKIRKRVGLVLFILLNALVIFYTASLEFSGDKPEFLGEAFGFKNILFLSGGLLCLFVVLACETVKYVLMMKHLNEKVSLKTAFETAALGKYYDSITPSGAGGQPFQIWHLHTHGYSTGASAAMPLSGFFTMQFGFVALALAVFIFGNNAIDAVGVKITAYVGAVAYSIVPVMILISAAAPKIAMKIVAFFVNLGAKIHLVKNPRATIVKSVRALRNYSQSLKKITTSKPLLAMLLLLSLVFQTALCSMPFFVIRAFGGNIGFFKALSMCVFIYAAITLIPTPGNAGAAEGSFYALFSQTGDVGAFWPMLVWRLLCYYSFIIIGVLVYGFNALEKIIRQHKEKPDESK